MKTLPETISEQIRWRRELLGLTRCQLGRELGYRDGTNVNYWESGRCMPGAYSLYDLANVFCCSVDDLMGRTHDD